MEEITQTMLPTIGRTKKRFFVPDILKRLVREKPLGALGGLIVLILLLVGIFANKLAPYGYNDIDLAARLSPPSTTHLLGTDNLGRDMLSRIIFGARISMFVGLGVATIGTSLAVIIGSISGFTGGFVDFAIQRFMDSWMALPALVVVLTIISVTGPGLVPLIIILGLQAGIGGRVRVIRSAVIALKRNLYIEAAKVAGMSPLRIIIRHVLPNIMAPIIVIFTMEMGTAIIAEATLSFLGFGVPPPAPSWGSMLSVSTRSYMLRAPWMALWAGLCLAIVVYGINMLGDALRDLMDPRLRGGLSSYSGKNSKLKHLKKYSVKSEGLKQGWLQRLRGI
jgi:peptide/nickel transport system permease protein